MSSPPVTHLTPEEYLTTRLPDRAWLFRYFTAPADMFDLIHRLPPRTADAV